jgi:thiol-disulfide isomerase/thioredoxin
MQRKYAKLALLLLAIYPWNSRLVSQITVNIIDGSPNATIAIVNPDYYLDNTPLCHAKISENGKGLLVYQIEKPQTLIVDVGNRETVELLVAPKENYEIIKTEGNIQFKGHNSAIHQVLYENRVLIRNFKFNNKTFIKWDFGEEFNIGIGLLEKSLQKNLDKLKGISYLDSCQLATDMDFKLLGLKLGSFLSKNTEFSSAIILSEYDEIRKTVPLNNIYFDNINYKSVLNIYSALLDNYYYLSLENDINKGILTNRKSQAEFIINEKFPQRITDFLLADLFLRRIHSQVELLDIYNTFSEHILNLGYKKVIENKIRNIAKKSRFNIYNETFFSELNKDILFKDEIPGRIVYMDIWATWCGPCIKEFKYSKELISKYIDLEELKFVYASIDTDENRWLKFLSTKNPPQGTHINLNKKETSTLFQELNINGIPRYIIINREGIIVDEDAPSPSNPKLREVLEKLYK